MKYIILWTKLLLTLILCSFCQTGWLDVKPDRNLSVPQTLDDFESLLDNTYLMNISPLGLAEISAGDFYVDDNTWIGGFSSTERNAYLWNKKYPYTDVYEWTLCHQALLTTNVTLEGLETYNAESESEKARADRIKGNALFQRARLRFELSQIWCPPITGIKSQDESLLGLQLNNTADIHKHIERSNLNETYSIIIDDMLSALTILPNLPDIKTRGSRAAAFAYLSKLYLQLKDYKKSGAYADSCLSIYNELLDFNTLDTTKSSIGMFNSEVIFHVHGLALPIIYSGSIDAKLYSSYTNDDLRKSVFFNSGPNNYVSFAGSYTNYTSQIFCGIATDEMYLNKAECEARQGNLQKSFTFLNNLLKMRWAKNKFIEIHTSNAEDLITLVLKERRKELAYRGQRWIDLRRLNQDPQKRDTVTRIIQGITYSLLPEAYNYTFPIPDDEIQLSNIKQNINW